MSKKFNPTVKSKGLQGGARVGAGRKLKPKPENEEPKPKKKRGGFKVGAGRKPKYSEETKDITLRIPISKEKLVREYVKIICEPLLIKQKNENE